MHDPNARWKVSSPSACTNLACSSSFCCFGQLAPLLALLQPHWPGVVSSRLALCLQPLPLLYPPAMAPMAAAPRAAPAARPPFACAAFSAAASCSAAFCSAVLPAGRRSVRINTGCLLGGPVTLALVLELLIPTLAISPEHKYADVFGRGPARRSRWLRGLGGRLLRQRNRGKRNHAEDKCAMTFAGKYSHGLLRIVETGSTI
jgi:hypothetical protein